VKIKYLKNNIEILEYSLIKDNNYYFIKISKRTNEIIIQCDNYESKLNKKDSSIKEYQNFTTIDEIYEFINKNFEEKKIFIHEIFMDKIILKLKGNNNFILILKYNKDIFNKNNDILNPKDIFNKNNDIFNPKDIELSNTFNLNSFIDSYMDNSFTVFKSKDKILYLIYSNKNKSIISYNLINNKKITEVKNAHNEYISNLRYYLDSINKKDLIISISSEDNNIKLWNFNNFECLLDIQNVNNEGFLFSASILKNKNENYIITSNCNWDDTPESMKVFDLKGTKLKEIKNSREGILFLDNYYDNELSTNFIVIGTINYVKSYNYDRDEVYHEYNDIYNIFHCSIIIYKDENITKLIESGTDGNVRIWNFHSGDLLNKIKVYPFWLYGICLWNNDHLFVGCTDRTIRLINLKNGNIINNLLGHNQRIITIKKINHPKYGFCLLSQGYKDDGIKLWVNKNQVH